MATHVQFVRDPDLNQKLKSIQDALVNDLFPDEEILLAAPDPADALLQDVVELDKRQESKSSGRKVANKIEAIS